MPQSNLIDIEIISDNENFKIIGSEKKSVLDVALDNNIDVPYSCQGGICSTCIARIKKGTVKMETNQILTDEEIDDGLILTCQAIPTSNSIIIDYDDV
jgi:ring-1,2-phenylacetyl-CoA epoxidase subunit PaaE